MAPQESAGLNDWCRIGFLYAVQDQKTGEKIQTAYGKTGELQRGAFRVQSTCFPFSGICNFLNNSLNSKVYLFLFGFIRMLQLLRLSAAFLLREWLP